METVRDFIFLGSKITADGDCSHEIKRCLLLGRKAIINLNSILKSRDITLPTNVHWVSDTIQPSHPLSSLSPLPSIFPSIRVFSSESALRIRWPKYWDVSFNISPSNEHSGLISLRMDWLDLLAGQGTPKSLLQQHSSKTSILQHSAFFIVQLTSIHYSWKNHSLG